MSPDVHVDEQALRERFAALEHPPESPDWAEVVLLTGPTTRQRPPRLRRPLVALAAALALAAVAGAAAIVVLGGESKEAAPTASATGEPLAALPAGPPTPGPDSMQQVVAFTLDELVAEADVVFVGVAEAVGGSEPVVPGGLTAHRVRFLVERPLRGLGEGLVDVTEPDSISLATGYDYAPGERYLVFAEPQALDLGADPVLVPLGYMQGVFRVTGEDTAGNDWLGEVNLNELESRLAP